MKIYSRNEWINDPILSRLALKSSVPEKRCRCGNESKHIELIDHESCIIGRIDTVFCTDCNEVVNFSIIR